MTINAPATSLNRDRAVWRNVDISARHKAFDAIFIEHEDVLTVEKILANKLKELNDADVDIDCERYYDTPNTLGSGLMVLGESGTGKTTFANRVLSRHPTFVTANQTFMPAVYMRIPTTVTPKGMGEALLSALRDPMPTGKAADLLHRCILLMRKCKVRILMIDDFQDIPARRSRGIAEIGDWVRTLIDEAPTLIIAMGTPSASIVRDSSDQVRKRIQATAHLLPFLVPLSDPGKWEEQRENLPKWLKILNAIDSELPLAESSNLTDPVTAMLLLQATNGGLSHLMEILRHAIDCAVEKQSESLVRSHLKEGFMRTFGAAAMKGNPFDDNYDGAPLVRPGQAFFKCELGAK